MRTACSCALGYLTYNAKAFRILLKECRNKPNQFLRLINSISKDASINPAFLKEFKMQQNVGLPSLRYGALREVTGERWPVEELSQTCREGQSRALSLLRIYASYPQGQVHCKRPSPEPVSYLIEQQRVPTRMQPDLGDPAWPGLFAFQKSLGEPGCLHV